MRSLITGSESFANEREKDNIIQIIKKEFNGKVKFIIEDGYLIYHHIRSDKTVLDIN